MPVQAVSGKAGQSMDPRCGVGAGRASEAAYGRIEPTITTPSHEDAEPGDLAGQIGTGSFSFSKRFGACMEPWGYSIGYMSND